MQTPEEIARILKRDIGPRADKLLKVHKKETGELADQMGKLNSAIEKKQDRLILLHTKGIRTEIKQLATRLSQASKLLGELDALDPEDGFGPNQKEVERLTGELAELERKLTKNFKIAKAAVDKGNDALEADAKTIDGDEVAKEWAVLEAWMVRLAKDAKTQKAQAVKLHAKAKKAAAARDAKAHERALEELRSAATLNPDPKELVDKVAGFWKKHDPKKLPKDLQQQVGRDQDRFKKLVKEMITIQDEMRKLVKDAEQSAPGARDHKKAAKVLNIPASHLGKLQKALAKDEAGMRKAFDGMSKELSLGSDGKQMVATLKKAKVL